MSQLRSLKELRLSGCQKAPSMPQELSALTALQKLNFTGPIKSLPPVVFLFHSLKELHLNSWGGKSLPDEMGQLTALRVLSVNHSGALQVLPSSISQCTMLHELKLSDCSSLRRLPVELGQLAALENLILNSCSTLEELPDSFCQLTALRKLYLSYCDSLESLPLGISKLSCLEELDLRYCNSLNNAALEEIVGLLSNLDHLNIQMSKPPLSPASDSDDEFESGQTWSGSSLDDLPHDPLFWQF